MQSRRKPSVFLNGIIAPHHPLVKHFVKLRNDPTYRQQQQSVLILGDKLIQEISEVTPPKQILSKKNATAALLKKISALPTFEESIAEFPLPGPSDLTSAPSLLVLDKTTDPGNVGTLLRTALGLGWGGVYFLPGCVDPFNDKVLRSSRAALFKLPWSRGSMEQLHPFASGFTPFVADIEGTPLSEVKKPKRPLLVLSNESEGVSAQMSSFGQRVTIPLKNMESLNVAIAGAILMYAFT